MMSVTDQPTSAMVVDIVIIKSVWSSHQRHPHRQLSLTDHSCRLASLLIDHVRTFYSLLKFFSNLCFDVACVPAWS